MKPRIERRPRAKVDVFEAANYLLEAANEEVALRFIDSVERALSDLAEQPGMGSPRWQLILYSLQGLRSWPVPGFENWLVFYLPFQDGIQVVRVLHGARDIEGELKDEGV